MVLFEGRWYCDPRCLKSALELRVSNLLFGFRPRKSKPYRLPLGLLLVSRGAVTTDQLRYALHLQRAAGVDKLGTWFCRMGAISEEQIAAALAQQWGCALFPLDTEMPNPSWLGRIPFSLLESARAVLAHVSPDSRLLHLAFGDRVDHFLLYAVEQMLDCRTVPCVAPETRIATLLNSLRLQSEKSEIAFDTVREPREIARIICNYTIELQATRIAISRVSSHIWVRFFSREMARDLLFRILQVNSSSPHMEPLPQRPKAFTRSADSIKDGVTDASGPA
jgi:hypothetical protein